MKALFIVRSYRDTLPVIAVSVSVETVSFGQGLPARMRFGSEYAEDAKLPAVGF
jgi:alpha-D-ribose 1-methylphosphonate 5-triphosphate synthase subunit PhnI